MARKLEAVKPVRMSDVELRGHVKRLRDDQNLTFEEIAEKLTEMGHVTKRGGGAIAPATARFYYYDKAGPSSSPAMENKLTMIKTVLAMKTDDKSKVQLIGEILKGST